MCRYLRGQNLLQSSGQKAVPSSDSYTNPYLNIKSESSCCALFVTACYFAKEGYLAASGICIYHSSFILVLKTLIDNKDFNYLAVLL